MRKLLFCILLIASSISHQALAFTLTVVSGSGVSGSPATSTRSYPVGTVVAYSYAPIAGFSAAVVVFDGKIAARRGSFRMNADHWIFAYGNPSRGVAFANMVTVPSDPTKVLYPQFFQHRVASAVKVADPYCAVTSPTISYPASYLGAFPMPKIVGAPLAKGVLRGGVVKDYWEFGINDPSTNAGCGGSLHTAFIATLKRLKAIGAQYVSIFRDSVWIDINAPTLRIKPVAEWSIPVSELRWIVQQAHAMGLKVYDYRQIQGDSVGNPLPNEPSLDLARRMLESYNVWIVDRAREAQAAGVDAFQLDAGGILFTNMTVGSDLQALFVSKFTEAAQKVRSVYHGKIMFGTQQPWMSGDPALIASIDYVYIDVAPLNLDALDDAHPTVAVLKQKYLDEISALANVFGTSKPAIFQVFAQSTRHWFKTAWIEDGFCVPEGANPCKQRKVTIDFSVQAIAYEAILEAIQSQTSFRTAGVEAGSYWFVDVILGKDAFPNLSQSWRNKPAEALLRKWFAKVP